MEGEVKHLPGLGDEAVISFDGDSKRYRLLAVKRGQAALQVSGDSEKLVGKVAKRRTAATRPLSCDEGLLESWFQIPANKKHSRKLFVLLFKTKMSVEEIARRISTVLLRSLNCRQLTI
jgi:hypothetical protein